MIKTAVVGADGKMGKALISLISESTQLELIAAVEQAGSETVGKDAGLNAGVGETGVFITDDLFEVVSDVEVVIDFTVAKVTAKNLEVCSQTKTAIVVATTGLSKAEENRLMEIGRKLPIVFASNYSIGMNATFRLVSEAARIFGGDVDIEIVESHHRHKIDAPSGTAITLGRHVAEALGRDLHEAAVHGRHGQTGARDGSTIGFHAIRGGEIVGEHTVMFISPGERLEITHRAQSRANFAEGAIRAAAWLVSREPGVYDMQDVLGLAKN